MTLHELADLVLRWVHLIAGIMWIGNSMLFNWLDRNLIDGRIWLLHSGGFYDVEKKLLEPHEMPAVLHWFKWQNFTSWASGIALLVVVYYLQADAFMVDPTSQWVTPVGAVGLGVLMIVCGWIVYDVLWTALRAHQAVAAVLSFTLLGAAAWGLCQFMSGRAAYIHVGVLLGTLMTGNVWSHIIPSQVQLVAATKAGKPQDRRLSDAAKFRSIHNNYMTFPLLFIMLSTHFPATYGSKVNWIVLAVLMVGSAGVRHFLNIRFGLRTARWLVPAIGVGALAVGTAYVLTMPRASATSTVTGTASFAEAEVVIATRCRPCHSSHPTDKVFVVAPVGIMMDTPEQIGRLAPRIRVRAVEQKTMPFTNRTGITEDERGVLAKWIAGGAPTR